MSGYPFAAADPARLQPSTGGGSSNRGTFTRLGAPPYSYSGCFRFPPGAVGPLSNMFVGWMIKEFLVASHTSVPSRMSIQANPDYTFPETRFGDPPFSYYPMKFPNMKKPTLLVGVQGKPRETQPIFGGRPQHWWVEPIFGGRFLCGRVFFKVCTPQNDFGFSSLFPFTTTKKGGNQLRQMTRPFPTPVGRANFRGRFLYGHGA